jgi:hypothetical protein
MPIRTLVLVALALLSWPALGATYYVRVAADDTADGSQIEIAHNRRILDALESWVKEKP